MNGVHDLGGMHGFGPVVREADEPVFHHEWERRVFALTLAAGFLGRWNLDMARHAREAMPPAKYLAATYYERWLFGLERLLEEHGLVSRAEREARRRDPRSPAAPAPEDLRVLRAPDVERVLARGGPARVDLELPPRFKPGDAVVARNLHPPGHTRLPRYVRGRRGIVERDHGVFVFPDTHAAGQGRAPQHLYNVRFAARELWGPDASPRDHVFLDLFESYLEPA